MSQTLTVQEFVIVIAAKNHNPTILNPDFLKYSGIVPTDWELARPPLYTNRVTQVTFKNGTSIVAEPNRIIFLEAIEGKAAAEVAAPSMARKYVQTLPNVDYQAIGINPRGYISFENQPEEARKYLSETLLSKGAWQEVGTAPVRTTVNYVYTLERSALNLTVNEASLKLPEEKTVPVVLFTGNFSYDIAGETKEERLSSLSQLIDNWQADLDIYKDIINTKFLTSSTKSMASVSDAFAMSASAA